MTSISGFELAVGGQQPERGPEAAAARDARPDLGAAVAEGELRRACRGPGPELIIPRRTGRSRRRSRAHRDARRRAAACRRDPAPVRAGTTRARRCSRSCSRARPTSGRCASGRVEPRAVEASSNSSPGRRAARERRDRAAASSEASRAAASATSASTIRPYASRNRSDALDGARAPRVRPGERQALEPVLGVVTGLRPELLLEARQRARRAGLAHVVARGSPPRMRPGSPATGAARWPPPARQAPCPSRRACRWRSAPSSTTIAATGDARRVRRPTRAARRPGRRPSLELLERVAAARAQPRERERLVLRPRPSARPRARAAVEVAEQPVARAALDLDARTLGLADTAAAPRSAKPLLHTSSAPPLEVEHVRAAGNATATRRPRAALPQSVACSGFGRTLVRNARGSEARSAAIAARSACVGRRVGDQPAHAPGVGHRRPRRERAAASAPRAAPAAARSAFRPMSRRGGWRPRSRPSRASRRATRASDASASGSAASTSRHAARGAGLATRMRSLARSFRRSPRSIAQRRSRSSGEPRAPDRAPGGPADRPRPRCATSPSTTVSSASTPVAATDDHARERERVIGGRGEPRRRPRRRWRSRRCGPARCTPPRVVAVRVGEGRDRADDRLERVPAVARSRPGRGGAGRCRAERA